MKIVSRRGVLRSTGALAAALAVGNGFSRASAQPPPVAGVKALVFDVFGTVVDWRNGVARDAERILKPLGYSIDWLAFACS